MERLTVNGFNTAPVDAGFLTSGMTPTGTPLVAALMPTLANRGATGDNLGFSFLASVTVNGVTTTEPGSVMPGTGTDYLVLYTAQTSYGLSTASVIDGSTANFPTYSPALPVPEPESYALMLAGLGLMGFVVRRRTAKENA